MESDYEYLKEQERTWESLGFNKFMERTTLGTNSNVMSSDDFNAMMQDGFINSSMVVSLSAEQLANSIPTSKILDEAITNAKIKNAYRAYNSVVSTVAGDGDRTDIQKAINDVSSLGGGIVLIKQGTYVPIGDITVPSNITIQGADRSDSIIDFNNTAYGFRSIGVSGGHLTDIHISNLTIKNNVDTTQGAIYFEYADDWSVEDCAFIDNSKPIGGFSKDIVFDHTTRFKILNNMSTTSDMMVYGDTGTRFTIAGNSLHSTVDDGINLRNCEGFLISGNFSNTVYGNFINLVSLNVNFIITSNNAFETQKNGLKCTTSGYGVITANLLGSCVENSIYIVSGTENKITSNDCSNNSEYGIKIGASAVDTLIDSNDLIDNTSGTISDSGTGTITGTNLT